MRERYKSTNVIDESRPVTGWDTVILLVRTRNNLGMARGAESRTSLGRFLLHVFQSICHMVQKHRHWKSRNNILFYLQWASHFTQGQSNEDMSQCRNRQDLPVLMSLQIPKKAVNTQTRLQVQKARRFPLIVVVSCHWPMLQICWRFLSNTLCAINPLINKVDSSNVS